MTIDEEVRAFTRLQVALRDPFADRAAVLRAAALDEASLARVEQRWEARLAAPDDGALLDEVARIWAGEDRAAEAASSGPGSRSAAAPEIGPAIGAGAALPSSPLVPSYLRASPAPESACEAVDLVGSDETQLPVQRAGPTLPFQESMPGVVPIAVQVLRGAGLREPPPPSADGDETAFLALPLQDLDPGARVAAERTTSTREGEAPAAPAMPLAAYARFLVEFAATVPAHASEVRRRHGIESEDAQRALGVSFAAWFAREPARRVEFDRLLAELRSGGTE